jgi:hypothetical protein
MVEGVIRPSGNVSFMSNPKEQTATDWSHLLTDPDLVSHIGTLLQTYRDAPVKRREEALLEAMRKIKQQVAEEKNQPAGQAASAKRTAIEEKKPEPPPFQPPMDSKLFTQSTGDDRRKHPRIRCYVAVEVRLGGSDTPIWGNLSNVSAGGCFVETLEPIPRGMNLEIGLWVNNGKVWVKGIVLNGVVIQTNPCFGVRIRFTDMDASERDTLRFFLKFVEATTKPQEQGYAAQLKR